MIDITLLTQAFTLLLYLGMFWFGVSLMLSRNDVADIGWGLNAVVLCLVLLTSSTLFFGVLIPALLIVVWGVRLAWHISRRVMRTEEDSRYAAWRASWGKWFEVRSLVQVFLLQSVLLWIVLMPMLLIFAAEDLGVTVFTWIGGIVWFMGFMVESLADHQLGNFVRNVSNKGKIMQSGLWRYSRHPNYFGEIVQWWGIGIVALGVPYGWIGLVGPWAITMLILFVSGVPLAEARMAKKQGFEDYKQKTSVLVPWFISQ